MAVLIRPRARAWTPPPAGATVDHGHPLSHGLAAAWVPASFAGGFVVPSVGGNAVAPMSVTGTASWQATPVGVGTKSQQSGTNGLLTSSLVSVSTTAVTLLAVCVPLSFQAANPFISHIFGAEGSGTVFLRFGDSAVPNNVTQWNVNGAKLAGNATATAGRAFMVAGTSGLGTRTIYVNGVLDASTTATTTATTNFQGSFGVRTAGGRGLDGMGILGYCWRRALTPTELQWLYAEPYAFFTPPAPRVSYFIPPPVAAGWVPRIIAF